MAAASSPSDRRRFLRVPLLGTAVLSEHAADPGRVFFVEDVSAGGVLVSGPVAPEAGAPVRLLLSLVGSQSMRVLSRVVRRDRTTDGRWRLGLEFERVPADLQELLQERVVRALERQGSSEQHRGLVIYEDSAERRTLGDDLGAFGYPTIAVEAVPEAADYLGRLQLPFAFAIADITLEPADAIELLVLVRRRSPALTCILMGDATVAEQLAKLQGYLGGCAVLFRPWTRETLWNAVSSST